MAGFAIRRSFGGHPNRSAKARHAPRWKQDALQGQASGKPVRHDARRHMRRNCIETMFGRPKVSRDELVS